MFQGNFHQTIRKAISMSRLNVLLRHDQMFFDEKDYDHLERVQQHG